MMIVSQTAEYALRAMAYLAAAEDGLPRSSKEISAATAIPTHYVSKVMRRLVVAGLLHAQKGHHGGFRLSRAPGDIYFEQVLAAADPDQRPRGCSFGYRECDPDRPCPLHGSWSELKENFENWAAKNTLADVRAYSEQVSVRRDPPPKN